MYMVVCECVWLYVVVCWYNIIIVTSLSPSEGNMDIWPCSHVSQITETQSFLLCSYMCLLSDSPPWSVIPDAVSGSLCCSVSAAPFFATIVTE